MENYPVIKSDAKTEDLIRYSEYLAKLRQSDIGDFNNLQNRFMSGRKVGKIPSSSADVSADDKVGDFNYSASYFYILVDNSGATWRRIALGSW